MWLLGLVSLRCSAVPHTEQCACVLRHPHSFLVDLLSVMFQLFLSCYSARITGWSRQDVTSASFIVFGFQRKPVFISIYFRFSPFRQKQHISFGHDWLLLTQHSVLQENINRVCKVLHANERQTPLKPTLNSNHTYCCSSGPGSRRWCWGAFLWLLRSFKGWAFPGLFKTKHGNSSGDCMRVCLAYLRAADEHSWISLLKVYGGIVMPQSRGEREHNTKTRSIRQALEEDRATLHSPQGGFLFTKDREGEGKVLRSKMEPLGAAVTSSKSKCYTLNH